ncbi:MAG TPA: sigma-54 dependent transcriptional regulator [bacterium]|jgi:DNA-binding NtrC family response regulator|nr:sigma-54 dependent transcriptional regulator [bacterium]HNT65813.1 sigma-54 dependent transcriptional regulator [bacterium]HOX85681.1 sigma-54 dependent transcriptional regulator [bacterium]HPG44840.1 sigma-54 dependent transcriptional regulator [bacterium]HPM98131.1 sigma-54 dependent transcriptional regulator [bacterium]
MDPILNSKIGVEEWERKQQETGIFGQSHGIRQLLETIEQVGPTELSVLITGESGTGKELVAKAIHNASSRQNHTLVSVNCGAIPEGIIESELFGHEKGSFTGAVGGRKGYFELADRGSIFLDEIGELPLPTQVKLLRVLEAREFMRVGGVETVQVDVRFIAATNKDLETEVQKGHFRQDLYYRLNALHIQVPALRERPEDIPILVQKFAIDFSRNQHIEFEGFAENAFALMRSYHWPGNIRELKNLVEKVIVLEKGQRISADRLRPHLPIASVSSHLPLVVNKSKDEVEREFIFRILLEIKSEIAQLRDMLAASNPQYSVPAWRELAPIPFNDATAEAEINAGEGSVAEMERQLIQETLMKTNGNKRRAARLLGLSERTLYRKIKRYGLGGLNEI